MTAASPRIDRDRLLRAAGGLFAIVALWLDVKTAQGLARGDPNIVGHLVPGWFLMPSATPVLLAIGFAGLALLLVRRESGWPEWLTLVLVLLSVAAHVTVLLGHFGQ